MNRRKLLKRAGKAAVVGTTVLAGCPSQEDPGESTETATKSVAEAGLSTGVYLGDESALGPWEEWFGRTADYYSFNVPKDEWSRYLIENMPLEEPIEDIAEDRNISITFGMFPSKKTDMRSVAAGKHDEEYRRIAEDWVDHGLADADLRIAHEMNGSWSYDGAVGQPDLFIESWRQIVNVLDSVNGTNFEYIWAPHIGKVDLSPEKAYPGDEFVDKIGLTFYDQGSPYPFPTDCDDACVRSRRQEAWEEIVNMEYGLDHWAEFSRNHSKSMVLAEYNISPERYGSGGGGDNPRFFENVDRWMTANSDVMNWHNLWNFTGACSFIGPEDLVAADECSPNPRASEEFRSIFGSSE